MRRRSDVQGLRAVAIVLVLLYHAGAPVPGGFTGVDVFFVISGFVITGTLLRELEGPRGLSLFAFYARRARRLLPALAVMLLAVAAVGTLGDLLSVQDLAAHTGAFASVFAANAYLATRPGGYFDVSAAANPLLHTWTLAVEEQFYFVFPILLLIAWRYGRSRVATYAVGIVTGASLIVGILLARHHHVLAFYGSPTRAWEFGTGAIVALVLVGRQLGAKPAICGVFGVTGAAAIVVSAAAIHGTSQFPGIEALIPVTGTALLLAAGTPRLVGVSRILAARPIAWIGDRSYSWYLWHWPTIVFAKSVFPGVHGVAGLAAAASLALAWLSYRFVENPIRRDPRFRGAATIRLAAVCLVVPVAASLALIGAHRLLDRTHAVASWNESQREHGDEQRGCNLVGEVSRSVIERCTWRVAHPTGRVVLIGDSQAGQFTEPFVRAAASQQQDAVVLTLDGCPPIGLRLVATSTSTPTVLCRRFNADTLDTLVRLHPRVIVFAARTDNYLHNPEISLGPLGGSLSNRTNTKKRLWISALESMLERLRAARIHAVIVDPVPRLPAAAADCAAVNVLLDRCGSSISFASARRALRDAVMTDRLATREAGAAPPVDPAASLCPDGTCRPQLGGVTVYRDVDHLSVAGAERFDHLFVLLLRDAR